MTLVEILALIVVLAMLAASVMPALASAGSGARLREAAFRARELDAKARLLSRCGTRCALASDQPGRLRLFDARDQAELASSAFDDDVKYALSAPVEFDRLGRSDDYVLTFEVDGVIQTWSCAGLTGLFLSRETRQ